MRWNDDLDELTAPLEDFTALHHRTLRRFGDRAIDLSFPNAQVANNEISYRTLAHVAQEAGPAELRYSPFGGFTTVRRRIAQHLTREHQVPYRWDDVVLTAGAASALYITLAALFEPGDRVLVTSPCWMDYPLYLAALDLECDFVVTYDGIPDLKAVQSAWQRDTKGMIISQPVSPTGAVASGRDLAALGNLLQRLGGRRNPAILIADETHRSEMWNGASCPAAATAYPHAITVHSFGKAWQMQGQRIGYAATSPLLNPDLRAPRRLQQAMRITGQGAPSALMQHVAAKMPMPMPPTANKALARLQTHARSELTQIGLEVVDAGATPFVYARSPIPDETAFVESLAREGVLAMPSALFHQQGFFRLALNTNWARLDEALAIIGTVTDRHA